MKKLFRPQSLSDRASLGLLILRILAGVAMIIHGTPKIQAPLNWMGPDSPVPGALQALAALAEFGGGFAWILGLLTPLASFGIACTMAVAVHFHAIVRGDPFVGQAGSYELAALYLAISVLLILAGPGKYAADHKIFR